MIDSILSVIAPHQCCGCGKLGALLCENCKYDIVSETEQRCLSCRRPCGHLGICSACKQPYERAWHVGVREGILQRLIGLYKFERAKSAYRQIADLLLSVLPDLPPETVVIPVPTASSHIRERGYDHMWLIARYVAKKRGLHVSKLLRRATQTKQRQSSAIQRKTQAKSAFYTVGQLEKGTPYLLLDDIMTTGSTITYAARQLKRAGARHVWVAIIARQTLD